MARAATAMLLDGRASDPEWPLRVADDYLRAIGFTLLAWAWLRSAQAALPLASGSPWHEGKVKAARFGIEWLLPESAWRWARVRGRDAALPTVSD